MPSFKAGKGRPSSLTTLRLVEAQPEPYRTLSALFHATGAEISAALRLRRRDVDLLGARIDVPGTKTDHRNRHRVTASRWALPYIAKHCADLLPEAWLFPEITRYQAYWYHRRACDAVGIVDYTVHDARHTWAVRAIRAGASFEVVRLQLGHASTTQVASTYGRFVPTEEERDSWERVA